MTSTFAENPFSILETREQAILSEWLTQLGNAGQFRDGRITEAETRTQAVELSEGTDVIYLSKPFIERDLSETIGEAFRKTSR